MQENYFWRSSDFVIWDSLKNIDLYDIEMYYFIYIKRNNALL